MSNSIHDPAVVQLLHKAGWREGRNARGELILPTDYILFDIARKILTEFGGLRIGEKGAGVDMAKCIVNLEPNMASGMSSEIQKLSKRPIYPLGEIDDGNALLFVDDLGNVYFLTDELELIASNFEEALRCLLLGIKAR